MKIFIIIWVIIQSVVLLVGCVWYYLDRKNEKHKKTPMILFAIGNFMMAIYFLILLPMLRKLAS